MRTLIEKILYDKPHYTHLPFSKRWPISTIFTPENMHTIFVPSSHRPSYRICVIIHSIRDFPFFPSFPEFHDFHDSHNHEVLENHEVLATERNHIMLTMILQHELSDSEACSANGSKTHRNPEGQAKRSNIAKL